MVLQTKPKAAKVYNHIIPTHIRAGVRKKSIPIHYLVSKDADGEDCYFIIVCPYQKLQSMLSEKQCVRPQDYGYVVASGFGKFPPQDICEMLTKEYGFALNTDQSE